MKVLFTFGGMPHYLIAFLNKIQQSGYDVVAVIPDKDGKTIGKGVKQEFSNIQFKLVQTPEYIAYYRKPFLKNFHEIIKNEKPDITITLWPYILGFVFYPRLLFMAARKKFKLVFREIPFMTAPFDNPINYYKKNPIYDENLKYQKTSGLFFYIQVYFLVIIRKIYYSISKGTINYTPLAYEIQPSYGVKKENIFVTHNSPNTDKIFQVKEQIVKEGINKKPQRIIHIGRLVKWKKVDLLFHSFKKVLQIFPDAELVIVGNGPEFDALKNLAEELQISNSIYWAGAVYDYSSIGKLLLSSDVYVLAGMGGLSINEAMAFEKPIICSVCDGTEKVLVRDGINGLFFKENDANDLAEKLIHLFNNPALIDQMGKNSFQIIKEEINIKTVVDNFTRAFDYFYKLK